MLKYRGNYLIRAGIIGVVLIMLVIAVGLQPERIVSVGEPVRYQALFSEAGGLSRGNDVTVSGMKVGSVSKIHSTTAMRWSASPSTASMRWDQRPPRTSRPDRCSASGCWRWSRKAAERSTRDR